MSAVAADCATATRVKGEAHVILFVLVTRTIPVASAGARSSSCRPRLSAAREQVARRSLPSANTSSQARAAAGNPVHGSLNTASERAPRDTRLGSGVRPRRWSSSSSRTNSRSTRG
jgi:hypothetical protein